MVDNCVFVNTSAYTKKVSIQSVLMIFEKISDLHILKVIIILQTQRYIKLQENFLLHTHA